MTPEESSPDPAEDRALRHVLMEQLPRHPAPPHLRLAIVALTTRAPRRGWWAPVLSALATALVMVLLGLPLLPRATPPDPLQQVTRALISEHTRSLLWGTPRPEVVGVALPRLMEETGIGLSAFFYGDDDVQLLNVEPKIVEGRRALAFTYQDAEGHLLTYLLLPGAGLTLPDRGRVAIDRYRPVLTTVNGFSLLFWKQQELACFLIAGMVSEHDLARFKQVFLKVRAATRPLPVN
jgi:hypothetical protein